MDNVPSTAPIYNCGGAYPSSALIPTPTTTIHPIQPIQPQPQYVYLRNGSEIQNMSQYSQHSIGTIPTVQHQQLHIKLLQ